MGNIIQANTREKHQESMKYGSMFIEIDSRTYKAGEKVEGVVHLFVKNITYPAAELCLSVTGVEKSRWAHEAKHESGEMKQHGSNIFLNLKD